ncbi:MAG TPA: hypothetical protein VMD55_13770 [Terracidiphilus sp.]|nr:hypothetical protein [Terracidiphilus sp.]
MKLPLRFVRAGTDGFNAPVGLKPDDNPSARVNFLLRLRIGMRAQANPYAYNRTKAHRCVSRPARTGGQRYSPAEVVDAVPEKVMENPNSDRICTSHIERQNLSIRMGMRRMTRLTNAFSKRWSNLETSYSLWFAFYNFCRIHKSLKGTPAMESGVADHVWELNELLV